MQNPSFSIQDSSFLIQNVDTPVMPEEKSARVAELQVNASELHTKTYQNHEFDATHDGFIILEMMEYILKLTKFFGKTAEFSFYNAA